MAYLLLILAAIFWGGNYVAGHILVSNINPYLLAIMRWGLTTLLMFSLYWKVIRQEWHLLAEKWEDYRIILYSLYIFLNNR